MPIGPRLYVGRPPVTPAGFGLLQTATVIDDTDPHWRNGVEFEPLDCDESAITTQQCVEFPPDAPTAAVQTKVTEPTGQRQSTADPFTVYTYVACSAPSFDDQMLRDRVAEKLTLGEGRAIEREFWTGANGVDPHLADLAAVTILAGGLPVSPVAAMGALEGALGECFGGVGMIHSPRGAIPSFQSQYLIEKSGQRLRTNPLETLIAAGGGYPGSGPDGIAAPAGQSWVFASGGVTIRRSGIEFVGTAAPEWVKRDSNDSVLIAERTYVITLDDCCVFAVLVDLNGCCC